MISMVRPVLPTASAGPSQAPTAAVDNSAPRSTHPEPTYKSGKTVQRTGTTSFRGRDVMYKQKIIHFFCRPCAEYHLKTHPHYRAMKRRAAKRRKLKESLS
jgi:hypothetical protein